MSSNLYADVEEFHQKFKLEYNGPPRELLGDLGQFRTKFLYEELLEYTLAKCRTLELVSYRHPVALPGQITNAITHSLAGELDALVDLTYVILGTAHLHGFDFDEAWRRVHRANMMKVRALRPDDSKRDSIFDVVKPVGWVPPSLEDLVDKHIHRI